MKGKNVETNLMYQNNYNTEAKSAYNVDGFKYLDDFTHLDVKDFFENDV